MDNATRRQLLQRHKMSGFPGSIIDVFKAHDQGVDIIRQFEQQQMQGPQQPATTAGLQSNKAASPPPPPPSAININSQISSNAPHQKSNLVESYNPTPPGISNLKMNS